MEEKILSIHPRRLARKMAKAQLDRRGATGYNKRGVLSNGKIDLSAGSAFSRGWRTFAVEASKFTRPRKSRKQH